MQEALASDMSPLQVRYLPRLGEARATLSESLHDQETGVQHQAEMLRKVAHRLAGAAGSFGYPDVSAAALELDREAKVQIATPGDPAEMHQLAETLLALLRHYDGG